MGACNQMESELTDEVVGAVGSDFGRLEDEDSKEEGEFRMRQD